MSNNNSQKFIPELSYSININSCLGEYKLIIGRNLQIQLNQYISSKAKNIDKIIIITDHNVANLYLASLQKNLEDTDIQTSNLILPAGEKHKTLTSVVNICNKILEQKITRQSIIIVLGGGVIGDIAGFVASIVLRGLSYIQIPTTLLAQIDSSVGGKTGVNTSQGKNLLGSFYPPKLVLADVNYLDSLPETQLKSGYVELLKHSLIKDKNLFKMLDNGGADEIFKKNKEAIISLIYKSVMVKTNIVTADETEQGERKLLNFGHTFAHALERIVNYDGEILPHGYAVSIGMVLASELSFRLNKCKKNVPEIIFRHLKRLNLPTSINEINSKTRKISFNADDIINAMTYDKKRNQNGLGFVLLSDIGQAFSLTLNSNDEIYKLVNQNLSVLN